MLPNAVTVTINVANINQALATVQKLGGKQIGNKNPVGEMGWPPISRILKVILSACGRAIGCRGKEQREGALLILFFPAFFLELKR